KWSSRPCAVSTKQRYSVRAVSIRVWRPPANLVERRGAKPVEFARHFPLHSARHVWAAINETCIGLDERRASHDRLDHVRSGEDSAHGDDGQLAFRLLTDPAHDLERALPQRTSAQAAVFHS